MNANNQNNNTSGKNENDDKQLLERINLEDTPFTAIKFGNLWYLTMGKYRLTDGTPNKQECLDEVNNTTWNRLLQIMQIMIEADKDIDLKKQIALNRISEHKKGSDLID